MQERHSCVSPHFFTQENEPLLLIEKYIPVLRTRNISLKMYLLLWVMMSISTEAYTQAERNRVCINEGWRFMRYTGQADSLFYEERPDVNQHTDNKVADTQPSDSARAEAESGLKKWILPTANNFINDVSRHYIRPQENPGKDFPFVQNNFNDEQWQLLNLPHDWAINGPFYAGPQPVVGGGMGRLPSPGVAWYRRKIDITPADAGKSIYLEIEGAMSYAMVWLNGILVGGWPYGYNSFQLNLTPYINFGGSNQLAIRIDNPNYSSRWYTGGGIYRNVWLTKTAPLHIGQWGTFITTNNVSAASAMLKLAIDIENNAAQAQPVDMITELYLLNDKGRRTAKPVAIFPKRSGTIAAGSTIKLEDSLLLKNPKLWGPAPTQKPHLYIAITKIFSEGKLTDTYETRVGIRSLEFDAEKGLLVNGQPVRLQGVNQHHDLGALGAAFNKRAAERQLELLKEMGCNAIRLAHNPPAPELLELTDRMGFLVINEIFDCWEKGKTPHDFHLIFNDWYEADIRSFIRRDRNHPSIIEWSFGNEVGEQYTDAGGAALAKKLYNIVKEEDPTRPATASMNYAKPGMPFAAEMDVISLNYQGEGIRDAPAYAHLRGIKTSPLYPAFKEKFPYKLIQSSETASALSTRGTYVFPVTKQESAPVSDSTGGDPLNKYVSAYELYTAAFGASPDKVFASQDKNPYVAGEFVWSGWDYLGEPTPYYDARSSYSGIIDLAGFKKDRFYLYQSRWRPALPMAHILPHWNWPQRTGMATPVHVFTSGDEAELFLNGRSLGKKKKAAFEYRLRWNDVIYEPGTLKVVAYKNGKRWAEDAVATTGAATRLQATSDKKIITANGEDLAFITVKVCDAKGRMVPDAANEISFLLDGPAEILATDNGNPAAFDSFGAANKPAYSGMVLLIIRSKKGRSGTVNIKAVSKGLKDANIVVKTKS